MIEDEEAININPVERIIRGIIGGLLFYLGTEVSSIVALFNSSYYTKHSIGYSFARVIASSPDTFRIIGWFVGFVLIFTGINGFCPFYKMLHINTNKKR